MELTRSIPRIRRWLLSKWMERLFRIVYQIYDICYAFAAVLKDRTVVTWGDKDDVIVVM